MIDKLPSEIISKIFFMLSIKDCRHVSVLYGNLEKLEQVLSDRCSIVLYLNQYFPNANQLLKSMLVNDAIISGSHAINYFMPGSANQDSDWDIYISYDDAKIPEFMKDLQKNGVKWYTKERKFSELINAKKKVVTVPEALIVNLSQDLSTIKEQYISVAVDRLYNWLDERAEHENYTGYTCTIKLQDGSTKDIRVVSSEYPGILGMDIIYGALSYQNKQTTIQLIVCTHRRKLLDMIIEFNATIAQCFISPLMACHMYAEDVYSRCSTVWLNDIEGTTDGMHSITGWIKKYQQRGFKFYQKSMYFVRNDYDSHRALKRTIGDPYTDIIKSDYDMEEFCPNYVEYSLQELYNYSWIENAYSIMKDIYRFEYMRGRAVDLQGSLNNLFSTVGIDVESQAIEHIINCSIQQDLSKRFRPLLHNTT